MCMCCRSLFVLLYFFFWPLCCLSFFWYTDSDCPVSIFKLSLKAKVIDHFNNKHIICKLKISNQNNNRNKGKWCFIFISRNLWPPPIFSFEWISLHISPMSVWFGDDQMTSQCQWIKKFRDFKSMAFVTPKRMDHTDKLLASVKREIKK